MMTAEEDGTQDNRGNVFGPETAPLTLIEYGDYQCSACRRLYPVVEQIRREKGNNLRFVFRHFPRTHIHSHAFRAAESAECASAQGHFWEMHDCLFRLDPVVDEAGLVYCAQSIGLDVTKTPHQRQGKQDHEEHFHH